MKPPNPSENSPRRLSGTNTGRNQERRDTTTLPQFLQDLVSCPPRHGSGVHQWLFKVARQLYAHRQPEDMLRLLTAAVDGCGRHVPEAEIQAAIDDAAKCAWQRNGNAPITTRPASKWPAVKGEARQAVINAAEIGLADLRELSPWRCDEDTDAERYIDELFPGNPLLCVGLNMACFTTAPRESFRGKLSGLSLVVPSPMAALTGHRKRDGQESAHTLGNTGPRHFLITEFDSGTPDEQVATIWHLRQFAPLALVLSSGGKSLHAWWNAEGIAEDVTGRFMRYAVSLGADPATWTRSQFVRLPQGWRADKERRQEVFFFDPKNGKAGA